MLHREDLLTIGQLSERSGVATSAIRFYESRGLLHSVRTTGNQRRYEQATLRRVSFIKAAQQVGLSLDEIAEALATLPEKQRTAVVLRFYEDLPEGEIASVLGCRPNTVRTLVHRGLATLRKEVSR